jgi:SAM-dependent methyltransferase
MAERLKSFSPRRILDIGCGGGHGLFALFEVFGPELKVVSLEENGACIETAAQMLSKAGIEIHKIKRLQAMLTPDGYTFLAAPIEGIPAAQCVLVESDICNDSAVLDTLLENGAFDAVTIWLTGTHMMRQFNKDVRNQNIGTDGEHRLYVQNCVYELADQILKTGGVLQVVDRTEAPTSDEMRTDYLDAHREQASVTSLRVSDLEYLPYEEIQGQQRTPMIVTPGKSGRVPAQLQTAMTSIISVKR